MNRDPYFERSEISNSDLSWLKKLFFTEEKKIDYEKAYRFGTLVDAVITEPHRVNFLKCLCDQEQYTADEFHTAEQMKRSFFRDQHCSLIYKHSENQKIDIEPKLPIIYEGVKIYIPARIKWDLNALKILQITGDIKSTTARTEKEFIEAAWYFDYFRQRAFYMDVGKSNKDLLIGISKVEPYSIFKIGIDRNSVYYQEGKKGYMKLAFEYWSLFNIVAA